SGQLERAFEPSKNGNSVKWLDNIANLPEIKPSLLDLNAGQVKIGQSSDIDKNTQDGLLQQLKAFHPWRKGPFDIFGIHIDTEWRSDWKWNRLIPHIAPLSNRLVLDVGCGNGYHCWRMLGAGARMVVGVDPLLLNVLQFQVIRSLYGEAAVYVLPMGLEQIPPQLNAFDTVFSMGVLYHRRSPIDHLLALKDCLRPAGELVLETLVIEGRQGEVLLPEGRYAKMRNVWFLPSCETLISWMQRCGFKNCRVIDVNTTTTDEQRTTDWMQFHSLQEFLDPQDPRLTCEGLPAPKRAIIIANAP
ncbi:MAG: tRNA 5-methoxyuridine(34)/uridine 5-oxyacetic acid(34) synthase CmoB, partial [Methylococcales bacterium]